MPSFGPSRDRIAQSARSPRPQRPRTAACPSELAQPEIPVHPELNPSPLASPLEHRTRNQVHRAAELVIRARATLSGHKSTGENAAVRLRELREADFPRYERVAHALVRNTADAT